MWTSAQFADWLRETDAPCAWPALQARMKQIVLYTLLGAQDTIDKRPRSFELFGCARALSPPRLLQGVTLDCWRRRRLLCMHDGGASARVATSRCHHWCLHFQCRTSVTLLALDGVSVMQSS